MPNGWTRSKESIETRRRRSADRKWCPFNACFWFENQTIKTERNICDWNETKACVIGLLPLSVVQSGRWYSIVGKALNPLLWRFDLWDTILVFEKMFSVSKFRDADLHIWLCVFIDFFRFGSSRKSKNLDNSTSERYCFPSS